MDFDESAYVAVRKIKPKPFGAVNTRGPCKDQCKLHKGKQRDHNSVFCKTCGVFVLLVFTKPRKGSGISCRCCNQRCRTKGHNSRKKYGKCP